MADALTDPAAAWAALSDPWRLAFEEAWVAWCEGNFGIGAALVDPTGSVVSVGRNRLMQRRLEPGVLAGNFMAHAEMNAFAAMDSVLATGLHLYTTLEPCLMCAATAIQLDVAQVNFAARDEFFDGVDELWQHHELTRRRRPDRTGPIGGPLEVFARVLPLSFTLLWIPDSDAADNARRHVPDLVALAAGIVGDADLVAVRDRGGTALEALTVLWDRLG